MSLPKELAALSLGQEELVVALSANHPLAKRRRLHTSDLAHELLILPPRDLSPRLHSAILAAFHQSGSLPQHTQSVEQVQTAISLAAEEIGVSLVPKSAQRLKMSGVVFRSLQDAHVSLELFAVWRRSNTTPLTQSIKHLLQRDLHRFLLTSSAPRG